MADRNGLWITGLVMLMAAVVLPVVVFASNSGSWEGLAMALVFTFIVSPILFIVGVVLLIVGLSRSKRQQQQQQIVVMDRATAREQGFIQDAACPRCGGALGGGEQFCTSCGVKLAHG